jgi:integrase
MEGDVRLTVKSTAALKLPPGQSDFIAWDSDVAGFGIRLRAGGARSWIFQFRVGSKQRRLTLGSVSAVDLAKAREIAKDLYARVRLGQDPASTKADAKIKSAETFEAIVRRFLAYQRARLRPRTYPDVERHLLKHSKVLHGLQLANITRRDIATVTAAVAENCGDPTSNRVRTSLSKYFAWCLAEGLIDQNPVAGTNKREEKKRTRVLSPDELRLVWTHAGDDHVGTILKLLALTGARANEIAALHWSEVHGDLIVLPPERVKGNRAHEIPLAAAAREIIEAQPKRTNADGAARDLLFGAALGPFSSWSSCKKEIDARIAKTAGKPLLHWTPHDLRRSFSTHANELGIASPHIIECCLGHVSGFQAGVASVYNLAHYQSEKRIALERWADCLLSWVEGRESNVVTLRQA